MQVGDIATLYNYVNYPEHNGSMTFKLLKKLGNNVKGIPTWEVEVLKSNTVEVDVGTITECSEHYLKLVD